MSLRQKTLTGVRWTTVSSLFLAMIQILQLVILVHYLEPSDFGLMAIVSVIIGFSALFMDMGISASIVHRQDITHIQLSSLYWLNIIAGIVLFIFLYFISPYLASFYEEPLLVPLVRLLSFIFLFNAIGNQYGILLQKELRFDLIAKISIIASSGGFLTAILSAVMGYGVYALVYGTLINTFIVMLLNLATGFKAHKVAFVYSHHEIRPMISFGMFQMGERMLNYFNSQFDVILIGKLLGTEALGIYSVAKNLSMRPAQIINPIITKVTFPVMSKVQNDMSKLKDIYLKTILYLSSINFPVYVLIAILSEPIVLLLFGEKWRGSIIILQILSLYGALRSIGNPIGSLQLAKGRADLGFYWNLGMFFLIPAIIYIGSFWGIVGVSISLLLSGCFVTVPNWYFMVKPLCGAGFIEYFMQILKPIFFSTIGGVTAYIANLLFHVTNVYGNIFLITLVMGSIVILLNFYFNKIFIYTIVELLGKRNQGAEKKS